MGISSPQRQRRLLVLGAGPAQLGLLRAARERGLFVVACDRDAQAPGFEYADRRAIVSAEDVSAGKPDPEVFVTAAARIDLPPARCIVVEDAAAGIEAARRGGMRSIGVSRTATLQADVFVRSLAELPADVFDRLISTP